MTTFPEVIIHCRGFFWCEISRPACVLALTVNAFRILDLCIEENCIVDCPLEREEQLEVHIHLILQSLKRFTGECVSVE